MFPQRLYAHDQLRHCYTSFIMQFDMLNESSVIWQPYTAASIQSRYPGGISAMCTRYRHYWLTKARIIFDISVEVMAQQRVMRQFGLRQSVTPPPTIPLPERLHV